MTRGRRWLIVPLLAVLALAYWLWGMGGADAISRAAMQAQVDVQNQMARALRALKAGEAGALATLWGLCFGYGFVHAAGPGHGKMVIGAYGVGQRVPALRLSGLALLSSLGQAVTAVALVAGGIALFQWGRDEVEGAADLALTRLSYVLIGGIGLWLVWRGVRQFWQQMRKVPHPHTHDHDHHGDAETCSTCGHAHGPSLEQAQSVHTWKDAALVIGAIAIRPCTGALFLLLITWRIEVFWAGVAGTFFMALGTAGVTIMVALLAVTARESALLQATQSGTVGRLMAAAQISAGLLIVVLAAQFVAGTL